MTVSRQTSYQSRFARKEVTTDDVTAGDIWARRNDLENDAASLLGHMLFEFSRLDLNLGLCLVWVDGGANIASLTKLVESQNLKARLDALRKHVDAKLPLGSKRHGAYDCWIERAHAVRQARNNFVHGRWGVEPHRNKVVNIIGLPTGEQQTNEYTIEELASINDELCYLQRELSRLREHWPL